MSELPRPSADALALSDRLTDLIRSEIAAANGWISFARFMELALYAPGLGYYSNGARKFGAAGDFVTAPELGSLFAACIARQLQAWLPTLPDVLEIGPGSGQLSFDLLTLLADSGLLPRRWYLLERSADLRQRQQEKLAGLPATVLDRIEWLDTLPQDFEGVMLANEVLDALPAHRVGWRSEGLVEQGVSWTGDAFAWSERPLQDAALAAWAASIDVPRPYTSEICPAAAAWVASLLQSARRTALLLIDYGYGRPEYYHPQRSDGTLTGFYRHHRVHDPFFLPGLMDLTTHVDFTAIADAALANDACLLGYTSQAAFLFDTGVTAPLQAVDSRTPRYLQLAQQVQQLTHPAEMGELFKVMAIGKGVDEPGPGFASPGREFQLG